MNLNNIGNQVMTDFFLNFPIRWHYQHQRWENEKDTKKIVTYRLVTYLCLSLLTLPYIYVFGVEQKQPGSFDTDQLVVTTMNFTLVVTFWVVELIANYYSSTIITALNMVADIQEYQQLKPKIVTKSPSCVACNRLTHLFYDPTGRILLLLTFGSAAAIQIIWLIFGFIDLDVICCFTHAWNDTCFNSSLLIKFIRCLVIFYLTQISSATFRYSMIFYCYYGMEIFQTLKQMLKTKSKLTWRCISTYRKCNIALNEYLPVLTIVTALGLSLNFVVLVVGFVAIIMGILLEKRFIVIFGGTGFATAISVMEVISYICCHIFEISWALRKYWFHVANNKQDRGYLKRVVQSLKGLSVPTGGVGVFDRVFKLNYMTQVASNSMNILVAEKML